MGSSCQSPKFKDKLLDMALRPNPFGLQAAFPESSPPNYHPCSRPQGFLSIFQPSLHPHGSLSDVILCQDAFPLVIYLVHFCSSFKGQFNCDWCLLLKNIRNIDHVSVHSALSMPPLKQPVLL